MGERDNRHQFVLVRDDILPDAMKKTLKVKELLERGKMTSISEAVESVDLSRSAFYKYRDRIFPFHHIVKEQLITLFFHLEDRAGALSKLLSVVAESGCNVLTIHQTIPLLGKANVTLSLDIQHMQDSVNDLLGNLSRLDFVEKVHLLSSGTS